MYLKKINLKNKTALVTGAGKGIGRACAIALAEAGADLIGNDDYIEKMKNGWTEIDKVVATPDMMPALGKLGKVLGPKGLMPNPKSGTVTMDIGKAVKELKTGRVELRVEKNGIIHASCGKISFNDKDLIENIRIIYNTIMKARPASAKGQYLKKITLSSTMGPGIKIDQTSIK